MDQLKLSNTQIGIILSLNPVVRVFATPFWGWVADRFVGRKVVYLLSVLFTTICFCSQIFLTEVSSQNALFSLSFLLRLLESFFNAPFYSLLDAEILASTQNKSNPENTKKLWGRARTWGSVGWAASSFAIGSIIESTGDTVVMVPLNIIFGSILFAFAYYAFEDYEKENDSETLTDISSVETDSDLSDIDSEVIDVVAKPMKLSTKSDETFFNSFHNFSGFVFLAVTLISAGGMILVEGLSFLYFVEELKYNYNELGYLVIVTVAFELPLFYYSDVLLKYLGLDLLLLIGLFGYSSRVLFYTLISSEERYWIFAVEWLHGITIAAITSARTLRVQDFTPKGKEATYQSIIWAIVALGAFLGEFSGGMLFDSVGQTNTYRTAAAAVLAVSLLHLIDMLIRRSRQSYIKLSETKESSVV